MTDIWADYRPKRKKRNNEEDIWAAYRGEGPVAPSINPVQEAFGSQNLEVNRLQNQIDKQRSQVAFEGAQVPEPQREGILSRIFDVLQRGNYAVANAVQRANDYASTVDRDPNRVGSQIGIRDLDEVLGQAIKGGVRGLQGKEKTTFGKVLEENERFSPKVRAIGKALGASDLDKYEDEFRGALGFGLDTGADPINFLGFGTTKAAGAAAKARAGKSAFNSISDNALKEAAEKAGKDFIASDKYKKLKPDQKFDAIEAEKLSAANQLRQDAVRKAIRDAEEANPGRFQLKIAGQSIGKGSTRLYKAGADAKNAVFGEGRPGYKLAEAFIPRYKNSSVGIIDPELHLMTRIYAGQAIEHMDDALHFFDKSMVGLTRKDRIAISHAIEQGHELPGKLGEAQAQAKKILDNIYELENSPYSTLGVSNKYKRRQNYVPHRYYGKSSKERNAFKEQLRKAVASDELSAAHARKIPTLEDAKAAGLKPEEDIAHLVRSRIAEHFQAMSRSWFVDAVATRFGLTIPQTKTVKKITDDAVKQAEAGVDPAQIADEAMAEVSKALPDEVSQEVGAQIVAEITEKSIKRVDQELEKIKSGEEFNRYFIPDPDSPKKVIKRKNQPDEVLQSHISKDGRWTIRPVKMTPETGPRNKAKPTSKQMWEAVDNETGDAVQFAGKLAAGDYTLRPDIWEVYHKPGYEGPHGQPTTGFPIDTPPVAKTGVGSTKSKVNVARDPAEIRALQDELQRLDKVHEKYRAANKKGLAEKVKKRIDKIEAELAGVTKSTSKLAQEPKPTPTGRKSTGKAWEGLKDRPNTVAGRLKTDTEKMLYREFKDAGLTDSQMLEAARILRDGAKTDAEKALWRKVKRIGYKLSKKPEHAGQSGQQMYATLLRGLRTADAKADDLAGEISKIKSQLAKIDEAGMDKGPGSLYEDLTKELKRLKAKGGKAQVEEIVRRPARRIEPPQGAKKPELTPEQQIKHFRQEIATLEGKIYEAEKIGRNDLIPQLEKSLKEAKAQLKDVKGAKKPAEIDPPVASPYPSRTRPIDEPEFIDDSLADETISQLDAETAAATDDLLEPMQEGTQALDEAASGAEEAAGAAYEGAKDVVDSLFEEKKLSAREKEVQKQLIKNLNLKPFPEDLAKQYPHLADNYFPEDIVKVLEGLDQVMHRDEVMQAFIKHLDRGMNAWKRHATVVNPGHHARNFVGDMFLNWLDDVKPRSYTKAANIKNAVRVTDRQQVEGTLDVVKTRNNPMKKFKAGETSFTANQWENVYNRSGLKAGFYREEVGRGTARYVQRMRKFAEHREDFARFTHFVDQIDKIAKRDEWHKLKPSEQMDAFIEAAQFEAGRHVRRYNFDYGDLTEIEQRYLRRIIPFYTFMRKNIPLQLTMAVMRPGKMARVPKGLRAIETMLGTDEEYGRVEEQTPQWLRDIASSGVQIAGGENPLYMTGALPIQDLERLQGLATGATETPFQGAKEISKEFLSSTHPLAKTIAELATGRNSFTGQDISSQTGPQYGANMVPWLRAGKDITEMVRTDRTPEATDKGLNYLFGLGLQRVTDQRKKSELRRQQDPLQTIIREINKKRKEKVFGPGS